MIIAGDPKILEENNIWHMINDYARTSKADGKVMQELYQARSELGSNVSYDVFMTENLPTILM